MIKTSSVGLLLAVVLTATIASSAPAARDDDNNSNDNSTISTTTTTLSTVVTSESSSKPNSTTSGDSETTTSGELFDFTSYQNTSTFTCGGKITGYYADVKLDCRVYHFCTQLDGLDGPSYQRMSYMCLEGSFFDQKDLNCVKKSDLRVPCNRAEAEYEKSNKQFDAKDESQPSMSDNLTANLMMNPIARFITGR